MNLGELAQVELSKEMIASIVLGIAAYLAMKLFDLLVHVFRGWLNQGEKAQAQVDELEEKTRVEIERVSREFRDALAKINQELGPLKVAQAKAYEADKRCEKVLATHRREIQSCRERLIRIETTKESEG